MAMSSGQHAGYWLMICKEGSSAEQEQTSTGVRWGRASGQLSPPKPLVWGGAGSWYWSSPEKGTSSWELPTLCWSQEHVGARSLFSVNDAKTTRVCPAMTSILNVRTEETNRTWTNSHSPRYSKYQKINRKIWNLKWPLTLTSKCSHSFSSLVDSLTSVCRIWTITWSISSMMAAPMSKPMSQVLTACRTSSVEGPLRQRAATLNRQP